MIYNSETNTQVSKVRQMAQLRVARIKAQAKERAEKKREAEAAHKLYAKQFALGQRNNEKPS